MAKAETKKGNVKWFDKTKGFGFIGSSAGDVFFHHNDIEMDGFKALAEGQRVEYTLTTSDRGMAAIRVKPVDSNAGTNRAARFRTVLTLIPLDEKQFEVMEELKEPPTHVTEMMQSAGMTIESRHFEPETKQIVLTIVSDTAYAAATRGEEGNPSAFSAWLTQIDGLCWEEHAILLPF